MTSGLEMKTKKPQVVAFVRHANSTRIMHCVLSNNATARVITIVVSTGYKFSTSETVIHPEFSLRKNTSTCPLRSFLNNNRKWNWASENPVITADMSTAFVLSSNQGLRPKCKIKNIFKNMLSVAERVNPAEMNWYLSFVDRITRTFLWGDHRNWRLCRNAIQSRDQRLPTRGSNTTSNWHRLLLRPRQDAPT